MAKYNSVKMNENNIREMVEFAATLQTEKRGVALQMMSEKFNCSKATAKKVLDKDPEAIELMKKAIMKEEAIAESNEETTNTNDNMVADRNELQPIAGAEDPSDDEGVDYTQIEDGKFFSYELSIQDKLGNDVVAALQKETIGQSTLRSLVDMFYQAQHARIRTQSQIRAIKQGYDPTDADTKLLQWTLESDVRKEKGLADALAAITERDPVCQWLRRIKGIGPIFAAGLRGMLNVNNANYATGFMSYAGLNDVQCPWLGKEKTISIMNETWKEMGLKKGECTVEFMERLGSKTGRSYTKILDMATSKWNASDKEMLHSDEPNAAWLALNLAKIPYNAELKTLLYKIADRWNKMPKNKTSLYTQLMLTRKQMETERNERGEYADYARKLLSEKKYTNKDMIKLMESGLLSKKQIQFRAYRVAEKVFLSHLFTAMYIFENGKYPPRYYSLDVLGHEDEIFPEVPYDSLFNAYEARTGLKADRHRDGSKINIEQDNLRNRTEKIVKRTWNINQFVEAYVNNAGDVVDDTELTMFYEHEDDDE